MNVKRPNVKRPNIKKLGVKKMTVENLSVKSLRQAGDYRSGMTDDAGGDTVDVIVSQWEAMRSDLDVSPIAIVGRISRLSRLIDRRLSENFARFGLDDWMYDVMATLYRVGPPHELTPGALVGRTMVTTGAITNRLDRLEARGLISRRPSPHDRRSVIVALTERGVAAVEEVAPSHLAVEREIVGALTDRQRDGLASDLRLLLRSLGDDADPVDDTAL